MLTESSGPGATLDPEDFDDSPHAMSQWQTMVDSGFITDQVQARHLSERRHLGVRFGSPSF